MHKLVIILFMFVTLSGCANKTYDEPHVLIKTSVGDIEIELYPKKAPITVNAFLENVTRGVYKNGSFYRVLKNENVPEEYNTGLVQGGIFKTNSALQSTINKVDHESPRNTGLTHESGTISMARTTPGSATSEFFICIGDQKQFDSSSRGNADGLGYAVFGKVVEGMKTVRKIQNKKSTGEDFLEPIRIDDIKKL